MLKRFVYPLFTLLLVAICLWSVSHTTRAQDSANDLLSLINGARRAQGLHPYVVSAELTQAAQRHSDDMAATGQIGHTGSDDSSDTQRILEAGYGAYEFGPLVGEKEAEPSSLAERLAPWALGLQGVALLLGIYIALRRDQVS